MQTLTDLMYELLLALSWLLLFIVALLLPVTFIVKMIMWAVMAVIAMVSLYLDYIKPVDKGGDV